MFSFLVGRLQIRFLGYMAKYMVHIVEKAFKDILGKISLKIFKYIAGKLLAPKVPDVKIS